MKTLKLIQFVLFIFFVINIACYGQWKIYTDQIQTGLIKGGNDTRVVCEDKSGNIWATSTKGDLLKFNEEKWTIYDSERISLLSQTTAGEIANAKTGSRVDWVAALDKKNDWIWFASNKNTMLWNGNELLVMTGILDNENRMVFYSKKDNKNYIIKNNSLELYSGTKVVEPKKPIIQIYSIFVDSNNKLWLGHWKGELFCLDDGKWIVYENIKNIKNQSNAPKGVYQINLINEDNSGNIWFCLNNCIVKYNASEFILEQKVKGAKSFLLDSKNNIWIGYYGGILKYNNEKWQKFENNNGLDDVPRAGRIIEDEKGYIWYCALMNLFNFKGGNIYKYDDNSWKDYPVDKKGQINDLYLDKNGTLWCATMSAIYKFENNTWVLIRESESRTIVYQSIFEDTRGNLWFGMGSFKGRLEKYSPN